MNHLSFWVQRFWGPTCPVFDSHFLVVLCIHDVERITSETSKKMVSSGGIFQLDVFQLGDLQITQIYVLMIS